MTVDEWINDPKTIKKSKKCYAHFDYRTDLQKQRDYVLNPDNIVHHRFFPFIHYTSVVAKFKKGKRLTPPKTREICYAAHKDRCVYQYYSFLLNEAYNNKLMEYDIDEVPVAYRTNLGITNIESAYKAIRFIRSHADCHVMIGDFTGFFDNLDHAYLKERWCQVLGQDRLPDDHYAVYKSITKYQSWDLSDILSILSLKDTKTGRKELNQRARLFPIEDYRRYKKGRIFTNRIGKGIPQGSSISAVLANIYMIEVDKRINEMVANKKGLYMRYSDDFIIIIPDSLDQNAFCLFREIKEYFSSICGLTLEMSKTQYYTVRDKTVENCGAEIDGQADCSNRFINFLGFTFDGDSVFIRGKTNSKYYFRMNRKARTIAKNGGYTRKGKHISCVNLYKKYSHYGAKVVPGKSTGNYLTYVEKSANIFDLKKDNGDSDTIHRDTRRHMAKIRKALKNVK